MTTQQLKTLSTQITQGKWKWQKDDGATEDDYSWQTKNLLAHEAGKINALVIRLEDIYPGHPECGQDLRMEISPKDALAIALVPQLIQRVVEAEEMLEEYAKARHALHTENDPKPLSFEECSTVACRNARKLLSKHSQP